jgi:hypothetical protein
LDDDEDPAPPPKRAKGIKKSQKKARVIDSESSSDDEHDRPIKKGKCAVPSKKAMEIDSDGIEEIQNPKETSEDELGKW